ncbi:spore coat protein CotJB [Diplocloster agilis]|uniref:Spore coat protein CotJB n=1 Tax=Diplocloster agilis TaxID=2850323 RepID=A0A949JX91_9FIRM|nr:MULTISPECIES: spore coat protein CotJB [Lachnospiraceae]MBU9736865.1 spore coat protein CotJB [Diplocloster agilis]MBU9743972.1 spore coat protein CotJB [Diplocloster agilis]MCU6733712.1 spore coat protein CotJB [Suonthocola fibrivorans]SCJ04651.1 CotJB protein [uncultured Clostridium sp.]
MNPNEQSREKLLHYIDMVSFAVDDVLLYLDTHPCDQDALAYFNDYSRMRNDALEEYARLYGPLTVDTATGCSRSWEWINQPWPWQEGGCY